MRRMGFLLESIPARTKTTPDRAPCPARSCDLDELEEDHLGRIRAALTELDDPRVAAGPVRVARTDLLEQLVDDEPVLAERREGLAPGVETAALGERDQLLDLGLDGLGLRLAGLDPLVLDQLAREVAQERLAMGGITAELVSLLAVAHRLLVSERQAQRVQGVLDL